MCIQKDTSAASDAENRPLIFASLAALFNCRKPLWATIEAVAGDLWTFLKELG